jgi:hypothetical protein
MPCEPVVSSVQEAFTLAEAAATAARDAIGRADTAISGLREIHEDLGGMMHELASLRGGMQQLQRDLSALDRFMRESLQKLGSVAVAAKRAAMKSHHDIEEVRSDVEDSKITLLRGELEQVVKRYDSIRSRDKAIFAWGWKVLGGIMVGVTIAWLLVKCGLHH